MVLNTGWNKDFQLAKKKEFQLLFEVFNSPSHLFFILASLLEHVPPSISGDEKKTTYLPQYASWFSQWTEQPRSQIPTFQISVELPLCCSQCSLDAKTGVGGEVPGLRHGGFFSGGRTSNLYFDPAKVFYTSTASVENHRPERTQTSLSITDHKEVLLSVRGSEGS